ncbi:protein-L-isoaspartate(D-aspartate) O-methyltransferase [candidate division KSB1 bacterium]
MITLNQILIECMTFLIIISSGNILVHEKSKKQDNFASRRLHMVNIQIVNRGVSDKNVIAAMKKVPRHMFVPDELKERAYLDSPLPIGEGQTISQPYIVAYMTDVLNLKGDEKVLEIGTGSGYQGAVLAEIVKEVYTIEIIEKLGKRAKKTLNDLGYTNITVIVGDGYSGLPAKAPFDAIIVTAAPKKIPEPLIDQLKVGGRMIIPVGNYLQELVLIEKTISGIRKTKLLPVRFVPMTGEIEKHR